MVISTVFRHRAEGVEDLQSLNAGRVVITRDDEESELDCRGTNDGDATQEAPVCPLQKRPPRT